MNPQEKEKILASIDQMRQVIKSIEVAEVPADEWKPPTRDGFLIAYVDYHNKLKPDHHDFRIRAYEKTLKTLSGGLIVRRDLIADSTGLVDYGGATREAINRTHKAAEALCRRNSEYELK